MNSTKRKFNALLSGIGNKSATSLKPKEVNNRTHDVPTSENDAQSKKRRISDPSSIQTQGSSEPTIQVGSTIRRKLVLKAALTTTERPKYAPWDRIAFLERLKTFSNLTDWTPKPDRVNEVEWAKRGWVCKKFERVRCCLCNVEILVKLNKKEVDGKEEPVYIAGNIGTQSAEQDANDGPLTFSSEEALVDKYVELIITSHDENCLWRQRGCDDKIFRLPLSHPQVALDQLYQRYTELEKRKDTLPYSYNLRIPPDFNLDNILSFLPVDFFTSSQEQIPEQQSRPVNRVALTMALFGWQGHTHERLGPQFGSVSCGACFRVLGLWLFKSKGVNEAGEEIEGPVVPGLHVVSEHRAYCPWRNAESQNGTKALAGESNPAVPGWEVLILVIRNHHRLTTGGAISPPSKRTYSPEESEGVAVEEDDETARSIRDQKDKERWTRMRRVKSLFEPKAKKSQKPEVNEKRKSRA
ncbi:hypothetical protein BP5796_04100 [Coleophoma crateriformis]|uniref:Uncharacterized protein n=1 Tax=Coleophoma crateriformis TaxID=565419 RepID=A0A3D8SHE9_9HELO|nr:hypothetical protein BP5796_04100 [Coleophoma crateriformis]